MMKKILAFALSATLVLGLTACGSKDEEDGLLTDVRDAMASSGSSDDSDDSGKSSTPPKHLRSLRLL